MGRIRIIRKVFIRLVLVMLGVVLPALNLIAEETAAGAVKEANPLLAAAAVAAVGLSCITSAYALGKIGSAAMGAMTEKPEVGGRALVFLGMAEGIAIYGLIVAIMILNKM